MAQLASAPMVDQPPHPATNENGSRGGNRQINPDRESQRRHTAEFEHYRDHRAEQDQPPWQLPVQHSFDDVTHERRLGSEELLHGRPVRALSERTINTWIDQPDRGTGIVHKVSPGWAANLVSFLPYTIRIPVSTCLRPSQLFRWTQR